MRSDLWTVNNSFLVGFGGAGTDAKSELVDARGQRPASGGMLHAWGIYAQEIGTALRWPLRDIVDPGIPVLDDPAALFLDRIVRIPVSSRVKGVLRQGESAYLLPFSRDFLHWLAPLGIQIFNGAAEPARQAVSVLLRRQDNWNIVELWIPVRNGLFVRTTKRYDNSNTVERWVPRIAVWPDFESEHWQNYFYYRGDLGRGQEDELVLEPAFSGAVQTHSNETGSQWWRSPRPATALLASDFRGREMGFALGSFGRPVQPPVSEWRLSVDLGSTHTRLFYTAPGQSGPQPLAIKSRAAVLTGKEGGGFDQEFFRVDVHPAMEELPTQVLISLRPTQRGNIDLSPDNWLPSDGVAVLGQVKRDFFFSDEVRLFTEVKWNLEPLANDPAVVFLSHLLLLAQAEAFDSGARLSEVRHSYPSAFPPLLIENFGLRWRRLLPQRNDGPGDGGSEAEALSVMKYLAVREGAAPATTLLAIDIGGSTSDIAVWQGNHCYCLESIRFAASAISSYLCLDHLWKPYCALLPGLGLDTSNRGPIQVNLASLPPGERLPLLYATLNFLQEKGQIEALRMQFESQGSLRPFLVHCSFIYGALLYYLGIVARELGGEPEGSRKYQLHLCGKGAKFFEWLERASVSSGLEGLFLAGLQGPGGGVNGNATVAFKPSERPKWEVGYGRLVEAQFDSGWGLFAEDGRRDRLAPRPVRAGESGYLNLTPHDPIDLEQLRHIAGSGSSAVPRSFAELENFLAAWGKTNYCLRPSTLPSSFRGAMTERLLGRVEGSLGFDLSNDERARRLSLEPLFITECKVFYELVAGVPPSLWYGKLPGWDRQ